VSKTDTPAADRLLATNQRKQALEDKKKTAGFLSVGEQTELNQAKATEAALIKQVAGEMGLEGGARAGIFTDTRQGFIRTRGSKAKLDEPVDPIARLFGQYGYGGASSDAFGALTQAQAMKGPQTQLGALDKHGSLARAMTMGGFDIMSLLGGEAERATLQGPAQDTMAKPAAELNAAAEALKAAAEAQKQTASNGGSRGIGSFFGGFGG
jgi:hypothetical protein